MDCVICYKSGIVKRVVTNAVRKAKLIEGDNGSIILTPDLFNIIWTNQILTPIYDDGKLIGYEETYTDIVQATPSSERVQPDPLTRTARINLLTKLSDIADLSFEELDTYIGNNVTDLASAKQYLIKLSKVTLATIKLLQDKLL